MAMKNIQKITTEQRQTLLSKSAYVLPDNPSDKNFSPSQIKRKLYEGLLVLVDYTNLLIDAINENTALSNSDIEAINSNITTLLSYFSEGKADYAIADENGNNIANTYETKTDASSKFNTNKSEIDKIKDGTTVVPKAQKDESGNNIKSTYVADMTHALSGSTTQVTLSISLRNKLGEVVSSFNQAIGGASSTYAGILTSADKVKIDAIAGDIATALAQAKAYSDALVARANLVTIIGNASSSLSGLMSATDKTNLDTLMALLGSNDADTVVDTIREVLAIFENYPEGADLVGELAKKVNVLDIVNVLTSDETAKPLSAKQGKVLKGLIDALDSAKANASDVYTKGTIDTLLSGKADKSDTYTKAEIQSLIAGFVFADIDDELDEESTNAIENQAVTKELNKKAYIDGNYPTLIVGQADSITSNRVIEDIDQACPPITIGTTGGEAEIADGFSRFKELYGNSFVWNSLFKIRTNASTYLGVTCTPNANGSITLTGGITGNDNAYINLTSAKFRLVNGHKYLVLGASALCSAITNSFVHINLTGSNMTQVTSDSIITCGVNGEAYFYLLIPTSATSVNFTGFFQIYDLTMIYGSGKEPTTVDEFKSRFPNNYYAHDAGTPISSKSYQLISRGENQWNEEWGCYHWVGGTRHDYANGIGCSEPVRVIGGETYYFEYPAGATIGFVTLDINGNLIGANDNYVNNSSHRTTLPQNCAYIGFWVNNYGLVYHNDVMVRLYWDTPNRNYVANDFQVVDLPNIELRSVGDVEDVLYSTGGGKRRIGKLIVDGTNNTNMSVATSNNITRFTVDISNAKAPAGNYYIAETLLSAFENVSFDDIAGYNGSLTKNSVALYSSTRISFYVVGKTTLAEYQAYFQSNPLTVLFELAEEQDITENEGWAELVKVNNFGTLEFVSNPQQVPQPEQAYYIEYTANYVDFIDTAFANTDGDANNFVVRGEFEDVIEGRTVVAKAQLADNLDSKVVRNDVDAYTFRTAGGSLEIGETCKVKEIVGGTLAFNQLVNNGNFASNSGWLGAKGSVSISNNTLIYTATEIANNYYDNYAYQDVYSRVVVGHKYLAICYAKSSKAFPSRLFVSGSSIIARNVVNLTNSYSMLYGFFQITGIAWNRLEVSPDMSTLGAVNDTIQVQNFVLFDLTAMFGSTIADYICSLETATAGDGVAWFKKYFPNTYYAYNTGTLVNVKTSGKKYVGFNQLDLVNYKGTLARISAYSTTASDITITTDGTNTDCYVGSVTAPTLNPTNDLPIKVVGGQSYNLSVTLPTNVSNVTRFAMCFGWYDANFNYINFNWMDFGKVAGSRISANKTAPENARYMTVRFGVNQTAMSVETFTFKDICVNFHYDGERDGEYEPYEEHTCQYEDIDLIGISKIDAQGNLYFDGDSYTPDGKVTRRYAIVDLGTLNWKKDNGYTDVFYVSDLTGIKRVGGNDLSNIIASQRYATAIQSQVSGTNAQYDKTISTLNWTDGLLLRDSSYSDKDVLKSSLSGVYLVYELATETEETTDTYQETQQVDNWGTEQYLPPEEDTRPCEIPVGHSTDYLLDIRSKVEIMPDLPSDDGVYACKVESGTAEYVPLGAWLSDNGYVNQISANAIKENIGGLLRHQLVAQVVAGGGTLDFNNTAWVDLGTLDNWSSNTTRAY